MAWAQRHAILAVLCGAYLLCYMDRMIMASAIPFIAMEFRLSRVAMGGVLSAFFVGYALMQLPGGLLADRFGPKRALIASICCWSVFTAATGLAASLTALLAIRVLFGLSEGPFPAAASKTVATWFPSKEVGKANGLQLAAVNIGAAIAPIVVAQTIVHVGWRAVFYALLLPGLLLALTIQVVVHDAPRNDDRDDSPSRSDAPVLSFAQVVKMPALCWCAGTVFVANLATWGLMSWLPTYLLQARGFGITRMAVGAALPYLAGAVGYYLSGHLSDRYFPRRRHVPIIGALLLAAAMTYWAAIAPNGQWAVVCLVVAFLFLFAAAAGLFTLPLLLVPTAAVGTAFGLVNTAGQVAAFCSPLLVGSVLTITHDNFTWVFYGFVGLLVIAAALALRIGRASTARIDARCFG
jgi:sugar phosphate permease